jgi:imidazoleglycerol phosphate synthase glutamine amidotransferase subunit HisH
MAACNSFYAPVVTKSSPVIAAIEKKSAISGQFHPEN